VLSLIVSLDDFYPAIVFIDFVVPQPIEQVGNWIDGPIAPLNARRPLAYGVSSKGINNIANSTKVLCLLSLGFIPQLKGGAPRTDISPQFPRMLCPNI
jgi:hypothetical protein